MPLQFYGWTMSKEIWELFRVILKVMDFEYEPSECYDQTHVEVFCSEQDAKALQATLETIIKGKEAVDGKINQSNCV